MLPLFLFLKAISKLHNIESVIISRGEIIEIGGFYRLPEIINETGLSLVEIGTTNKTRLSDYKKALEKYPNSLILKVHIGLIFLLVVLQRMFQFQNLLN